jgi:hypothetical protein
MKRLLRARGIPATLIAIVAVLAGASGGYALAAGSSAITACVSHKGGTLYQAKKCKKHDHKISWSQAGPQGMCGECSETRQPASVSVLPFPRRMAMSKAASRASR